MGTLLLRPESGWSALNLCGREWPLSYVDNVPWMFLHAVREYLEERIASVEFDCEGWEFILIITPYELHIIEKKDTASLHNVEMAGDEFCRKILEDFLNEIDAWIQFLQKDNPIKLGKSKHLLQQEIQSILKSF